jgi:hypothetical protein
MKDRNIKQVLLEKDNTVKGRGIKRVKKDKYGQCVL